MSYVAVISWRNINNAGDEIIGTITGELIKKNTNCDIRQIQIYPGYKELFRNKLMINAFISNCLLALAKLIPRNNIHYSLKGIAYSIRLKRYFRSILKESKAIVYAVGMLKFSSQNQSFFFDIINEIAVEYNIPIIISGVSVAKPDVNDWRFKQLLRSLNETNVKLISTRDGEEGVKLLKESYINKSDISILSIGDPALLLNEYYIFASANKHSIGLGLIRMDIFDNYGKEMKQEDLFAIYSKLIDLLENNHLDWQLFCNGMSSDYKFGKYIIKRKKLPSTKLAKMPQNAEELISLINGYEVVIAARLHASIISTALGKPVTGFYWEDKVRCFARETHQSEYYLEVESLSADNLFDCYKKVNRSQKDYKRIEELRSSTRDSFKLIGEIINEFTKG